MKILVTGGAGFIGSAVVRLAIARGYRSEFGYSYLCGLFGKCG